ncbi:MAG: aspartate/glutamate racemase family protein [Candidatus Limiplasma sp.]|nr:aspartate/glutamate racemase family protein [Candidatus Limiplasma sp.]
MQTIGLIGGMSWESTVTYYQILNERVNAALGGYHSAKILLHSVDFAEVEAPQRIGDWARVGTLLAEAARRLERGGADVLLLGTNTMHLACEAIEGAVSIPFLHIADATADALVAQGHTRAALLGTRVTMEQPFYRERLERRGIEVLLPNAEERALLHRVIFEELCFGKVLPESRESFVRIIERLAAEGAQAAILGCTEIGMLVRQSDTAVPLVDTTVAHAERAARWVLEGEN